MKHEGFQTIPWRAQKQDNINSFLSTWHVIGTNDFFGYFELLSCNIKVFLPPQLDVELEVRPGDCASRVSLTPRCPRLTCITSATQVWLGQCFQMMPRKFLQVIPQHAFSSALDPTWRITTLTPACRTHRVLTGVPAEAGPLLAVIVLQLLFR